MLDTVERVTLAATVPEGLLLDPASALIDSSGAELHDMEGVEDRDGVLQLVIDRVLVPVERVEGSDLQTPTETLTRAAARPVPALPATRSNVLA